MLRCIVTYSEVQLTCWGLCASFNENRLNYNLTRGIKSYFLFNFGQTAEFLMYEENIITASFIGLLPPLSWKQCELNNEDGSKSGLL